MKETVQASIKVRIFEQKPIALETQSFGGQDLHS